MMKNARKLKHLVMLLLCALFIFIGVVTVHAATYYVATTGSDLNNGTAVGTPFRSIQKCINTVAPGDTCTVADGTYDVDDGGSLAATGIVGYIQGANGTAADPITIKSTNPLGAHIKLPTTTNVGAGFYVARAYYIIEGFDISGGTSNTENVSYAGIALSGSATGSVVRKNAIHNIARTVCSNGNFGNSAVYLEFVSDVTVDQNTLYSIGRLRNGENGCVTDHFQHDHGIYIKGSTNTMISRNVIYDTNRGFPLHIYGATTTNLSIYNNTLCGKSPTGAPIGQILLASTITTANIKNNISYGAQTGMITHYSLNASGVFVDHNLSSTAEKTGTNAGVTFSNNLQNTSPGFVEAVRNNFHLSSGSAAIDAGTNVGLPFKNGAPDIGAREFGGDDSTAPHIPQNVSIR